MRSGGRAEQAGGLHGCLQDEGSLPQREEKRHRTEAEVTEREGVFSFLRRRRLAKRGIVNLQSCL